MDYLNWVGAGFAEGGKGYTRTSFMKESQSRGICRRVGNLPKDIEFGKTRLFFVTNLDKKGGRLEAPEVFGYTYIAGFLAPPGTINLILKDHPEMRGLMVPVTDELINLVDPRGCGLLQVGAHYLVDAQTLQDIADLMDALGIKADALTGTSFIELEEPVTYTGRRFRGIKRVDGDALLDDKPLDGWFPWEKNGTWNIFSRGRETFRGTIVNLLVDIYNSLDWTSSEMEKDELMKKALKRNLPTSRRPEWVYHSVISALTREAVIVETSRENDEGENHFYYSISTNFYDKLQTGGDE